jgi:hypothetical protein
VGRTFEDHARAVVELLRSIADLDDAQNELACNVAEQNLIKYTIAASCHKMYTRLKPSNLRSADFFDTLTHLDGHWSQYKPRPPSTPKGSPKYSVLEENFLKFVLGIQESNMIDISFIPHLLRLAKAFKNNGKAVRHLYTKDTYREIHHLLCKLLAAYREHLRELTEFKKSQGKTVFSERVHAVTSAGLFLHTMAYGPILERHFAHMASILGVIMQARPWENTTSSNDPEERESRTILPESKSHLEGPPDQDDPDSESYQDSELIAVQPDTKLTETTVITPSQSFHKWSRLMVSYFEAGKIVVEHVKARTSKTLSLTIIKIPHQGQRMMSWSDVADSGSYDAGERLATAMSYVDSPPLRFSALDESTVDLATDDTAWAKQLNAITNAADFRRAIKYIQNTHSSATAELFNPEAPLSTGEGFKGTVHCEAGLASLSYARNTEYSPLDEHSLWFAQVC